MTNGLPRQKRDKHLEVFTHMSSRAIVRESQHVLDNDFVRETNTQREPIARRCGGRHCLLRERRRVARIRGRNRSAQSNSLCLSTDNR